MPEECGQGYICSPPGIIKIVGCVFSFLAMVLGVVADNCFSFGPLIVFFIFFLIIFLGCVIELIIRGLKVMDMDETEAGKIDITLCAVYILLSLPITFMCAGSAYDPYIKIVSKIVEAWDKADEMERKMNATANPPKQEAYFIKGSKVDYNLLNRHHYGDVPKDQPFGNPPIADVNPEMRKHVVQQPVNASYSQLTPVLKQPTSPASLPTSVSVFQTFQKTTVTLEPKREADKQAGNENKMKIEFRKNLNVVKLSTISLEDRGQAKQLRPGLGGGTPAKQPTFGEQFAIMYQALLYPHLTNATVKLIDSKKDEIEKPESKGRMKCLKNGTIGMFASAIVFCLIATVGSLGRDHYFVCTPLIIFQVTFVVMTLALILESVLRCLSIGKMEDSKSAKIDVTLCCIFTFLSAAVTFTMVGTTCDPYVKLIKLINNALEEANPARAKRSLQIRSRVVNGSVYVNRFHTGKEDKAFVDPEIAYNLFGKISSKRRVAYASDIEGNDSVNLVQNDGDDRMAYKPEMVQPMAHVKSDLDDAVRQLAKVAADLLAKDLTESLKELIDKSPVENGRVKIVDYWSYVVPTIFAALSSICFMIVVIFRTWNKV